MGSAKDPVPHQSSFLGELRAVKWALQKTTQFRGAKETKTCIDNNSANRGNGGAVFFDAHSEQNLALQLVQSHVENNVAKMGGRHRPLCNCDRQRDVFIGGLFFDCSKREEECLVDSTDCPSMALMETQFSSNEASIARGAVFTGYLEAFRFRCPNTSSVVGLPFHEEREWKDVRQVESDKDICSSWKGNRAEVYGHDVATYATTAQMTVNNAKMSICTSGGVNCVIEGYRVGTDLPTATVKLIDGLGQRPARNYRPVNASMSSPSNKFLLGSIIQPMESGSFTFQSIRGFVPPGEYNLTVEFDRMVIKNVGITVKLDNCSVAELISNAGFCEGCSSTTYNFVLSATVCRTCPENGNCESRVITPNDGYWQKTPCSDHLHRCLPTSACESKGRSGKLNAKVEDVSNCDFGEEWIEDYTRAQCSEVSCILDSSDVSIV